MAWRLNASSLSRSATVSAETRWPYPVSSSASLRVDFVVHRSGDHRIPAHIRLDQGQQRGPQSGIYLSRPLAPATKTANPAQRFRPRLQLVHAFAECGLADLGRLSHRPDSSVSQDPGLSPHQQTALPLVQVWEQHLELHRKLATSLAGYALTTPTSCTPGSNTLILCEPLCVCAVGAEFWDACRTVGMDSQSSWS